MSPLATVEVRADATTKDVNLNVGNNIAGLTKGSDYTSSSSVYYGSHNTLIVCSWKIAETPTDKLTLFSTECIGGLHKYDGSQHNNWSGSDICKYLNGTDSYVENGLLPTYFTDIEKSDTAISAYGTTDTTGPNASSIDISQKIVLPSVMEVRDGSWGLNNSTRAAGDIWWLRSPSSVDRLATYVHDDGVINSNGDMPVHLEFGVRPAFNLNLSSILFTSAIGASKSTFASISENYVSDNTWKLTLIDANDTSFEASLPTTVTAGETVTVSVNTAGSGSVSYNKTSAMLVDSNGMVVAYGSIGDVATGEKSFRIPDSIAIGTYQLKVFPEQVNSGNQTDYAGQVVEQQINVASVSSVTVSPNAVSVNKGKSQSFTATVSGDNSPSQAVSWRVDGKNSNDTTISNNGLLTIALDETATQLTVTATSTADPDKEGTATITVLEPIYHTITVNVSPENAGTVIGGGQVIEGQSTTLTATANTDYRFKEWTKNGSRVSTDTSFTVSNIMEDATYTAVFEPSYVYDEGICVVKQKVDVSKRFATTEKIKRYRVKPSKYASVNSKGVVLAKKAGEVTIRAYKKVGKKYEPVGGEVKLKIEKPKLTKITATKVGQKAELLDHLKNSTNRPTKWKISKTKAATLDETTGEVTAVKNGTATITAYFGESKNAAKYTTKVTVKIPRLSASKVKLRVGKSRKLKVMNTTVKPTAWKSSNPSVATVDTKGKIKAVAVGESTISATVDGVDYSCTVTVK